MRLLLDDCVPRGLSAVLTPHEVDHVTGIGWAGIRNGELLCRMIAKGYVGLITTDRTLSFQQAVHVMPLFVVVLFARSNRLADLRLLAPDALRTLEFAQPGQVYTVGR